LAQLILVSNSDPALNRTVTLIRHSSASDGKIADGSLHLQNVGRHSARRCVTSRARRWGMGDSFFATVKPERPSVGLKNRPKEASQSATNSLRKKKLETRPEIKMAVRFF
jgi:hypothetical protein